LNIEAARAAVDFIFTDRAGRGDGKRDAGSRRNHTVLADDDAGRSGAAELDGVAEGNDRVALQRWADRADDFDAGTDDQVVDELSVGGAVERGGADRATDNRVAIAVRDRDAARR
jgi:hypothetical protein